MSDFKVSKSTASRPRRQGNVEKVYLKAMNSSGVLSLGNFPYTIIYDTILVGDAPQLLTVPSADVTVFTDGYYKIYTNAVFADGEETRLSLLVDNSIVLTTKVEGSTGNQRDVNILTTLYLMAGMAISSEISETVVGESIDLVSAEIVLTEV
jgi:hypothetical protein